MITDGAPQYFWRVLDEAVVAMGFTSLFSKFHIPGWLIMGLAYIVVFLGDIYSAITGRVRWSSSFFPSLLLANKYRLIAALLTALNLPALASHCLYPVPQFESLPLHTRLVFTGTPKHVVNFKVKLNPFAAKMLMIHRYFDISAAKRDLKYEPIIQFKDGWASTIAWFQANWLPKYIAQRDEAQAK